MKKDLIDIMIENVGTGVFMTLGSVLLVMMMFLLFFGQEITEKLVDKLENI